jgi:hypothetical protein
LISSLVLLDVSALPRYSRRWSQESVVAIAEAAALFNKRPAATKGAAPLLQYVGGLVMDDDFYAKAMENYMETRAPRARLCELQGIVTELEGLTLGSTEHLELLVSALNLQLDLEGSLRRGEVATLAKTIESLVDSSYNAAIVNLELEPSGLNQLSKMIEAAKLNSPHKDTLHECSNEIARRLVECGRTGKKLAVENMAIDVVRQLDSVEQLKKIEAALQSARGLKFCMGFGSDPELNKVAFARLELFRVGCANIGSNESKAQFEVMQLLLDCADDGPDEAKFSLCLQAADSARAVFAAHKALSSSAGDEESLLAQLRVAHFKPLVDMLRLRSEYLAANQRAKDASAGTVIEQLDFAQSLTSQLGATLTGIERLLAARLDSARTAVVAVTVAAMDLSRGRKPGKCWEDGLKKGATFDDLLKHAKKPLGLLTIDPLAIIAHRDAVYKVLICVIRTPMQTLTYVLQM